MRYKYVDLDGEHTRTEEEILKEYFPRWKEMMERRGKADQISNENCISDWVVTNWAWEDRDANNTGSNGNIREADPPAQDKE